MMTAQNPNPIDYKVILASASPRRLYFLQRIGLDPTVLPTDVDESTAEPDPDRAAVLIAERKVRRAAELFTEHDIAADLIIAADTSVVVDGRVLGKPADPREAGAMLRQLSGRGHAVVTGVAVMRVDDGALRTSAERTIVHFSELSDEEIDAYVATGEPMDKAGAYGIQEKGAVFVSRIEGCYFNVAGIPLNRLAKLMAELDFPIHKVW